MSITVYQIFCDAPAIGGIVITNMFATQLSRWIYRHIVKPLLFRLDPENVHDRVICLGGKLGRTPVGKRVVRSLFCFEHPALVQNILGIRFPNPIGLTAGFDKNAELTSIVSAVGFGFEEIGSITGEPCDGNPKPRLWRLPKSKGLVVWYGLKNDGCLAIAKRLQGKLFDVPIGVSIAKTNSPSTVDVNSGIADYEKAFRTLHSIGDYVTVNISCPNAYGGEPFANPERLELLLARLDKIETTKPVFIKLPVDISTDELDALAIVAARHRVHGVIISNLTKRRNGKEINQEEVHGLDKGGISGKPIFHASNKLITHLFHTMGQRFVIIGSGGVFTAEDAYEKIRRGASLVQLATGMIFEGPQLIGEINRGLVRLLERDGFKNIGEAIGSAFDNRRDK